MAKDTRTYADRREYSIRAVAKRRTKFKQMAVDEKGGKCQVCGYCRYIGALDFHHIDEKTKKFGLSKDGLTRSWKRVFDEIQKCVLICSNCHREVHAGMIDLSKIKVT